MFLGHFGVGFAAKTIVPKVSLGTLFLAAQFIDLLWPSLLLLGLERARIDPTVTRVTPLDFVHYPISHSLLAVIGWAIVIGLIHFFMRRNSRNAFAIGALVISHWLLDAIVHRPDLPLYPGSSALVGLGLWNSLPTTLAIEFSIFSLGVWLYMRATTAMDKTGKWALWSLVIFLTLIYMSNIFGPLSPDIKAVAWVGHAQWLLVAWAYWIDKHRRSTKDFAF
jgi:LexA-binding, inner membrane-associated putative hydrolase